jgi:cyclopropane-fatty-acyl-phospholipid synthase
MRSRSLLPFHAHRLLDAFANCTTGAIEATLPGGDVFRHAGNQPGPHVHLKINDWSLVERIAARGNIGVGETYVEGLWDTDDLPDFITFALLNEHALQRYAYENSFQRAIFYLYNNIIRSNHHKGSKANIRAHYDVGNDFYRLWLDPTMTYSSALRRSPDEDLSTAQSNKYHRILDRLEDTGARILEIGCGWGGFAEAAINRAHNILGVTLSRAQRDFAAMRLQDRADIILKDYRNLAGKFDHLVSIEMFEAVGERYWPDYFYAVKNRLAAGGKAVIQTITINENTFEHYRRHSDYIRHYTFPGGMLPSRERFCAAAEAAGMAVKDVFTFGQDYAWTLDQWRQRFMAEMNNIKAMGFSETFIRSWLFYFGMCIGAFRTNRTDVMQVELQHA